MEAFEEEVKRHYTATRDIHAAFGQAMRSNPAAYCRYLREDALPDAQDVARVTIHAGARLGNGDL